MAFRIGRRGIYDYLLRSGLCLASGTFAELKNGFYWRTGHGFRIIPSLDMPGLSNVSSHTINQGC